MTDQHNPSCINGIDVDAEFAHCRECGGHADADPHTTTSESPIVLTFAALVIAACQLVRTLLDIPRRVVAPGQPPPRPRYRDVYVPTVCGIPVVFAELTGPCLRRRNHDRIYDLAPELEPGETWYQLSRITSAVIGIATIDRMLDPVAHGIGTAEPEARAPLADDQRRWFFGPIGYVLRDVRALATSVPCRGWQGFWTLTPDDEARVMGQL